MSVSTPFHEYVMAMERVERRLRRATAALDAAHIPYAVVGGNAVAAWVASRDSGATRTTKDVDLLVNHGDVDAITRALAALGFRRENLRSLTLFVDPEEENRKTGVHLVWAGAKVRPSSLHPAPTVDERVRREGDDYWLIDLPALLRMKLTSFRPVDQTHLLDMLSVGLIDDTIRATLPADLLERLRQVEAQADDEWV